MELQSLRTPGPGSRPAIIVAVALLGVALAIAKPWDTGGPVRSAPPIVAEAPASTSAEPATPKPGQTPWVSLLARSWQCYYASDWRVFALGMPVKQLEELASTPAPAPSGSKTAPPSPAAGAPLSPPDLVNPIRTWIQVTPAGDITDPTDPRIPFVRIVDDGIPALGYCAPLTETDRPPDQARTSAWSLGLDGSPVPVELTAVRAPDAPADTTEGLYAPVGQRTIEWTAGRYVFVVRDPTPGAYARWFGVEIVDPPGPLRSATP